jgi:hypothetical protein
MAPLPLRALAQAYSASSLANFAQPSCWAFFFLIQVWQSECIAIALSFLSQNLRWCRKCDKNEIFGLNTSGRPHDSLLSTEEAMSVYHPMMAA